MKRFQCVLGILLTAVMALTLTSCGGMKPEAAAAKALDAVKACDTQGIKTYFGTESLFEEEEDEAGVKEIFSKLSYTIQETKQDGDKATVKVDITTLDMKAVLEDYMAKSLEMALGGSVGQEDMDKKLEDLLIELIEESTKTVTNTVEMSLTKDGDSWKAEATDDLLNAVTGGLKDVADSMADLTGE